MREIYFYIHNFAFHFGDSLCNIDWAAVYLCVCSGFQVIERLLLGILTV